MMKFSMCLEKISKILMELKEFSIVGVWFKKVKRVFEKAFSLSYFVRFTLLSLLFFSLIFLVASYYFFLHKKVPVIIGIRVFTFLNPYFYIVISVLMGILLILFALTCKKDAKCWLVDMKLFIVIIANIAGIAFIANKYESSIPPSVTDNSLKIFSLSKNKINFSIYEEKKKLIDKLIKLERTKKEENENENIADNLGTLLVISIEEGPKTKISSILNLLNKFKVRGLFVSKDLVNMVDCTNTPGGFSYLLNTFKEKCNGFIYMDIYPNTLMNGVRYILPQLALSSSHSLKEIYKSTYDYGINARRNFAVDIVLEPSVDRAIWDYDFQLRTRTFGVDSNEIYLDAFSFIRGLNDAGIATLIKHFPSHPQIENRDNNSETKASLSYYSVETLRNNSRVFYSLISNPYIDTMGFLTDHVRIVNWGKNSNLPYTLVENGLKNLLKITNFKDELNFTPISITDDLCKLAIRNSNGKYCTNKKEIINKLTDISIKALKSGHDLILIRHLSLESAQLFLQSFRKKMIKCMEEDPSFKKEIIKKILRVNNYYKYIRKIHKFARQKPLVELDTDPMKLYKKAFIRINIQDRNISNKNLINLIQDTNKSEGNSKKLLFVSQFIKKDDFRTHLLLDSSKNYNLFYIGLKRKGIKTIKVGQAKYCESNGNDFTVSTLASFLSCISLLSNNNTKNDKKEETHIYSYEYKNKIRIIKPRNVTINNVIKFLNSFDYIIISVNDWHIVPTIKTIYSLLKKKNKLILIFMDSPNCLFDEYQTKISKKTYIEFLGNFVDRKRLKFFLNKIIKTQPAEILLKTSSFYIYKNDKYAISSFKDLDFAKLRPLNYLTINIPNFYYYENITRKGTYRDFFNFSSGNSVVLIYIISITLILVVVFIYFIIYFIIKHRTQLKSKTNTDINQRFTN